MAIRSYRQWRSIVHWCPSTAAAPSFPPDLGQEVIEMLEDFCNAHHEFNATEVVRKAGQGLHTERPQPQRKGARDPPSTALQANRRGESPGSIRPMPHRTKNGVDPAPSHGFPKCTLPTYLVDKVLG